MPLDRAAVARMIDHTLLKPEATAADVERLCAEAVDLGVLAVCVSPSLVTVAVGATRGRGVLVACVAGFPSGAHVAATKAFEAGRAVDDGADEVDMVIDLGLAKAGRWDAIEAEIAAVRSAVSPPVALKVILETGALTPHEIDAACRAAVVGGADFVKTSTGFHQTGGATEEAVRRMRAAVGPGLGVKASGGVRTAEAAIRMIEAGATRLGTSSSAAILAGLPG